MRTVSVIVPVLNQFDQLKACLFALDVQTYPMDLLEVIVVDNGSATDFCPPEGLNLNLKIFKESTPGSYAARNWGIRVASGEILAFTDADCMPDPTWVEAGVGALKLLGGIGIVGGRIRSTLRNPSNPTLTELYDHVVAFPQDAYIKSAHFAATANMFAHRCIFKAIGLFDASLQSGGDTDWCQRAHANGFVIRFANDSVVSHPVRASLREIVQKQRRIAAGQFQRNILSHLSIFRFCLHIFWELRPPLIRLKKIWHKSTPVPISHRILFSMIAYYLRFVNIVEKMRLRMKT